MTARSPLPEQTQSGRLLLQTKGACDFDPGHLLDVFGEQRQWFAAVLQGFGPEDWAAPTRCAEWSAHDVVRHLCDCNAIGTAFAAGTDDGTLDITADFDRESRPAGGWPPRPASRPAPPSAGSWRPPTNCSLSPALG